MEERFTEDQVAERLSRYHDDKYTFEYASGRAAFRSLKLAAVLVPLFVRKGQVCVCVVQMFFSKCFGRVCVFVCL